MPRRVQSAGPLRHRVTVQRPAAPAARDAYGQPADAWDDVDTVWAAIEPLAGRELFAARQVQADVTHQVTTRHGSHLAGFDSSWRIVYAGRVFAVEAVTLRDEVAAGWLDWLCREAAGVSAYPLAFIGPGGEPLVGPNGLAIQGA